MFLLSAGYYFTREAFVTTILISWLTTAAAALTLVHFARTAGHAVADAGVTALPVVNSTQVPGRIRREPFRGW